MLTTDMKTIDPEEVVRKYIYAKDNHDWDQLVALLDPDFTSTDPSIPEPVKGIKAVSEYFPMLDHVGMKTTIHAIMSKGDDVAAELEVTCTVNLAGETHSFTVKMAKFYRVNSKGLLADEREYSDTAAKFGALGEEEASAFQSLGESAPDALAQLVAEPTSKTEHEYSDTATKVRASGQDATSALQSVVGDATGGSETSENKAGDETSGISTTDPTPKSIFEATIPENLKANLDKVAGVNAVCQFNITGDAGGSWYIDMTVTPPTVVAGTSDRARCTMTCTDKVLAGIVGGQINATMAVITGKVKITGDMGVASALRTIVAGGDRELPGRHD
jgi:putative sterol carrier protein